MNAPHRSLVSGFLRSAGLFPDRPAVEVEKRSYTYGELRAVAGSYAAALDAHERPGGPRLTAVFASRTFPQFAGVLASLMRGHGYVPLNRAYPAERTRFMVRSTDCRAIVVDRESSKLLKTVLEGIDVPLVLLLPESEQVDELKAMFPAHTVLGAKDLAASSPYSPASPGPGEIAYIIFTSGTTGVPKGVMVTHSNIRSLVDFMADRYRIDEHDRHSQVFSFTFDGSVFDMFVPWERGACVCCPSQNTLLNPGAFIAKSGLTIWFSVPSLVLFMERLGSLKKGGFPNLRLGIFGGEPVSEHVVRAFGEAAPRSDVEILYGPTEMTIACTHYRWNPLTSPSECYRGIAPIGFPNPGLSTLVCDQGLEEVPPGAEGELLMTGPQRTPGYLNDEERTKKAFVVPPGRSDVYYRTGDLVRRPRNSEPIVFVGRIDLQVKILGHRVELGEIEAVIRNETGIPGIVALGWPVTMGGAEGVEVFIENAEFDTIELKKRIGGLLPEFMVPRKFHFIGAIPLTENGKYDRRALARMLEERQ